MLGRAGEQGVEILAGDVERLRALQREERDAVGQVVERDVDLQQIVRLLGRIPLLCLVG